MPILFKSIQPPPVEHRIECVAKNLPIGSVVNDIELAILSDMIGIKRTALINGLTKYLTLSFKRQSLIHDEYVNFYTVRLKSTSIKVSSQN
jgi:hypothetical protein